jgi:SNF2 family DNA or RNA helicase
MNFLSPKILGYRSFWSFAANHLEYEMRKDAWGRKRRTGRIIRSHNEEYLAARVAPYVYQVRKDECLTLPEKLYETRVCTMTGEQWELYERAKHEILLRHDYDDWSPVKIFRLFTALQTITCGWWNRTDPDTGHRRLIEVPHHRLSLLTHAIADIPPGEPVLIWAKYRRAVQHIRETLATIYDPAQIAEFHGHLTETQRADNIARWRAGARFLIATQDTGGQVHTFNEAAYAIFYADSFKYDKRAQAEDRNHRIGQWRPPVYVSLSCTGTIDDRITAAIETKGDSLAAFQRMVNLYRTQGMRSSAIALVKGL